VIHTVGPNRHVGQTDPALLTSCFETSLRQAAHVGARSLAFPAVSAGVYGWDASKVAQIAVAAVRGSSHLGELDLVRFVLFSPATAEAFLTALSK
jgi:O-acetyl-ADP-ribose deacetylase (regulator of RNase III)